MVDKVDKGYKELVDMASEKSLDFEFPNSSAEHAKYVISKIIEKSKKSVFIFSKDLNHEIFNNEQVIQSLRDNKSVDVKILLEELNSSIDETFSNINTIKIKKCQDNFKDKNYFVLGDKSKLRICTRDTPHKAIVNFGDKRRGDILNKEFAEVWTNIV